MVLKTFKLINTRGIGTGSTGRTVLPFVCSRAAGIGVTYVVSDTLLSEYDKYKTKNLYIS
jgi:hypothetical protein